MRRAAPAWLMARPIAHRGLHDARAGVIENSLTAFAAAATKNYAIECDLRLTLDGEVVVFHDEDLHRLTGGAGHIAQLPLSLIQKHLLISAHSGEEKTSGEKTSGEKIRQEKTRQEKIPSLRELLTLIAGRVPLILELKSAFQGDIALVPAILPLLRAYSGNVAVKSFDPQLIATLRALAPEIPRGIVAMCTYDGEEYAHLSPSARHALANLLHFDETEPDFLSWHHADLPSAAPFLCRSQLGLPVMSWTIRAADEWPRIADFADQMVFEGFLP